MKKRSAGTDPTAKGITLASNGAARADIVVAKNAPAPVQHAAAELGCFLRQATGADFEIRRQPGDADSHLLVGPGAARCADQTFTTDDLGQEGIVLRSSGNNIILAGGHPRGTLYAVFTFLEDYIGCRWWSSDASTIPSTPTLTILPLNVRYVPPLEYRYPLWTEAFDPDWAVRNKSNGPEGLNEQKYGGNMTHGGVHTFYRLIPPEKYFKEHPEWFSLVLDPKHPDTPGERRHDRRQLCLANEAMRKELIRNLKKWIREKPDQRVFSVSQNDWDGHCMCGRCRAMDDAAGSHAGSLLKFVNAVAEEVEQEFPDVSISTLAYQYTRKPPAGVRPRPNVIIQLCSIECDFSVPMTDERNRAFRDDIIGWSKVAERLYIWDYVTNFSHHFLPHPNLRVLGPNVRFFVKHNAKGIFEQGAYTTRGAEFAELRAWVLAKLLWNPELDDRALIEEFCNGYYGPAGQHILAYIDLIHDSSAAAGEISGCFAGPTPKYLSFDVLKQGCAYLQAAAEAVADNDVLAGRVEMARLPVMYAFMSNWRALRAQCKAANAAWPLQQDIESVAEEFKRIARVHKVTRVNEWHEGFGLVDQSVAKAKADAEGKE